jgi:hypothetical protein
MDANIKERPTAGHQCASHYPRSWIAVMFAGERLNKLRIVYSDESEQGAIVVVAAVMLNMDTHWKKLEADFDRLPEGWRNRREVKGNKLFRDLRSNRGPESETALRILCSIPAARQVEIFSGAVDRNALGSLLPYDVAFRVCLDDVESYVDKFIPKENVLWIADVGHQSDLKMSFNMQQIMSLSSTTAALGLSPDNAFESHIADTIYFGDSHESRALQLADVCCSVIAGHLLNDPVVEPYYEMIRPRLTHEPRILGKY